MTTYTVTYTVSIEADSEAEAIENAQAGVENSDGNDWEAEVEEVIE